MQLNDVLEIHDQYTLLENKSYVISVINKLKSMTWDRFQSFLRDKVKEFFNKLENSDINRKQVIDIVNKRMWANIKSPNQLNKTIKESRLDEGFKEWWKEASGNLYGALSFYPILMTFIELDKVIKQTADADLRAMAIYFIVWVAVVTGKVVSGKLVSKNTNDVKAAASPSQVR